eukprot:scaffold240015_cov102-Attheya_sp.AAC.1
MTHILSHFNNYLQSQDLLTKNEGYDHFNSTLIEITANNPIPTALRPHIKSASQKDQDVFGDCINHKEPNIYVILYFQKIYGISPADNWSNL